MLVLTRRVGEEIVIAGNIRVTVVMVRGQTIRLGITAPSSVPVARVELLAGRPEGARSPTTGRPGKCQERGCASTESAS
jgi:carbon storage regulator